MRKIPQVSFGSYISLCSKCIWLIFLFHITERAELPKGQQPWIENGDLISNERFPPNRSFLEPMKKSNRSLDSLPFGQPTSTYVQHQLINQHQFPPHNQESIVTHNPYIKSVFPLPYQHVERTLIPSSFSPSAFPLHQNSFDYKQQNNYYFKTNSFDPTTGTSNIRVPQQHNINWNIQKPPTTYNPDASRTTSNTKPPESQKFRDPRMSLSSILNPHSSNNTIEASPSLDTPSLPSTDPITSQSSPEKLPEGTTNTKSKIKTPVSLLVFESAVSDEPRRNKRFSYTESSHQFPKRDNKRAREDVQLELHRYPKAGKND